MAARILVGDDDPDILDLFSEVLTLAGYEVIAVNDGRSLLTTFENGAIDLVVTDMRMPHADGLQVLEGVKHHSPRTPVIVITGHSHIDEAVLRARGASACLDKPLRHLDDLTAAVAVALAQVAGSVADGTQAR